MFDSERPFCSSSLLPLLVHPWRCWARLVLDGSLGQCIGSTFHHEMFLFLLPYLPSVTHPCEDSSFNPGTTRVLSDPFMKNLGKAALHYYRQIKCKNSRGSLTNKLLRISFWQHSSISILAEQLKTKKSKAGNLAYMVKRRNNIFIQVVIRVC